MNIQKNSWHYKVYCWFTHRRPSTVNLCPYVRAVFLWAPLKWLFMAGKIYKVPLPAITIPALLIEIPRWIGMVSYDGKMILVIIECCFAGVAAVIGAIVGTGYLLEENNIHPIRAMRVTIVGAASVKHVTSATAIVHAYVKSFHEKVCPILRVDEAGAFQEVERQRRWGKK